MIQIFSSQCREFSLWSLAALLLLAALRPGGSEEAAAPGKKVTFLPVPDFDTDPNEGQTYGILPVWIVKNEQDIVQRLYAPSINYNDLAGVTGAFRLIDYPEEEAERKVIASVSQHNDRRFLFDYVNREFLETHYFFGGAAEYSQDGFARFFGLGPETLESAESNYSRDQLLLELALGYYTMPKTRFELRERFRKVKLGEGLVDDVEDARRLFADVHGIAGGQVWSHQVSLVYDGRDSTNLPTRGLYASGAVAIARDFAFGQVDYEKYTFDLRYFFPLLEGNSISSFRVLIEGVTGDQVPFFELPSLGGGDTLRGFGDDRFVDEVRVLLNFEQRCIIHRRRVFGIDAEFEVAPFVDLGNVASTLGNLEISNFRPVGGVGLRALTRPDVLGRLDLGFGEEGLQAFISLGYSF